MVYCLVGRVGGRDVELQLRGGAAVLGSDPGCDLVMHDTTVSRRHAELTPMNSGVQVIDLGSKNGTYVGAVRIERRGVGHGESLRFGRVVLQVESSDPVIEVTEGYALPDAAAPAEIDQTRARGRNPFECFVAGAMQDALHELAAEPDLTRLAAIVGHGLAMCLPLSAVEIGWKMPGTGSTLYCHRQDGIEFSSEQITRIQDDLYLYCAFKTTPKAHALESLLDTALGLVVLAKQGPAPDTGDSSS
jgi:pSer/pThr/pTyr-binding forkhead associated (FHA) protein